MGDDPFDPTAMADGAPTRGAVADIAQERKARDDKTGRNNTRVGKTLGDTRAGGPNVAADQLRALVERIERLDEEKAAIADDIKCVYGEAKSHGFDTKALRRLIALRKIDLADRQEQDAILHTYMVALGMAPADPVEG